MSESEIGCEWTDGEDGEGNHMEEVITTKKGSYGHIRITVLMPVKEIMLLWGRKSGMGRAEFFRVALMIGVKLLAESVNAKKLDENYEINKEGIQ
ncbi:MAG: hypothetical protein A2X24_12950 [Chloroflexi bacterium GWB2_54_36]|nr:MAG: hypothetical protein A2X24_12950 [Chloroflexi bacterium GWB2_54_36]